jgi:hypothetical protein
MEGTGEHNDKWNKTDSKGQRSHFSSYVEAKSVHINMYMILYTYTHAHTTHTHTHIYIYIHINI